MAARLFSHTVLNADGSITCTHPATLCKFTFHDPNDLAGEPNAVHWEKQHPLPVFSHYIPSCACPIELRQIWFPKYQDRIIRSLEFYYNNIDVYAIIDVSSNVGAFWNGNTITANVKTDAQARIENWDRMVKMLATCKAVLGIETISADDTLTAKSFLRDGAVLWGFPRLTMGTRKEGDGDDDDDNEDDEDEKNEDGDRNDHEDEDATLQHSYLPVMNSFAEEQADVDAPFEYCDEAITITHGEEQADRDAPFEYDEQYVTAHYQG
jgi:hypothetical protein